MASKRKGKPAPKREPTREELAHDKERAKQGWKREKRPDIEKWEAGVEVSGSFMELRDGQFGKLLDLRDEEGVVRTYGAPTMLAGLLKNVESGTDIMIECVGKMRTSKGQDAWDFRLYTRDGEGSASDEDTPF